MHNSTTAPSVHDNLVNLCCFFILTICYQPFSITIYQYRCTLHHSITIYLPTNHLCTLFFTPCFRFTFHSFFPSNTLFTNYSIPSHFTILHIPSLPLCHSSTSPSLLFYLFFLTFSHFLSLKHFFSTKAKSEFD